MLPSRSIHVTSLGTISIGIETCGIVAAAARSDVAERWLDYRR